MKDIFDIKFRSKVSLVPLLDFWEEKLAPQCHHMARMFNELKQKISRNPAISGDIDDIGILNEYYDILKPLMTAVFSPASFSSEIAGALTPCTFEPFYVTPMFQKLFIDNDRFMKGSFRQDNEPVKDGKLLRIYFLVLSRVYGISVQGLNNATTRIVTDEATGLDRYYSIVPDFQFVTITPPEDAKTLSDEARAEIMDNMTDIKVLGKYIDLNRFEFTGFTIVRALDVTESEVISALERDLIDHQSIFSAEGIELLESRLRVLLGRKDIDIGIGAIHGEQIMILKNDCESNVNCLFANSHHIDLNDIKDSVWVEAVEKNSILRIPDLGAKKDLSPAEQHVVDIGVRSMLISPLSYQDQIIGILEIFSRTTNDFGPVEILLLEQVTPVFSAALKRGLDELEKTVQAIIKEKCTAVHPSVEWRFEQAAVRHMERLRQGKNSEMEPIVFKGVIPFFGQSDVRGSSYARNRGIQQDLIRQLTLAHRIMDIAAKKRQWPILEEYRHRIETKLETLSQGINSGDESTVASFLTQEVASTFKELSALDAETARAIEDYNNALDPELGIVYDKRKEYEASVFTLNKALSAYLTKENDKLQQTFPHYFEKRQTDGVDYMIYIGASMRKSQELAPFHIKNMTLWQLMLACGLAWHGEKTKPQLKVPLDTCHLILVNHSPLSIRFRFDEKRFDVDGAYDVRQEIIKSRLDKAIVKGTRERLTQPARIAIVYSRPDEGEQIKEHIAFLINQGKLNDDLEFLDLDEMPEVRGLKALRVGINLESETAGKIIEMKAG